MFIAPFLDKAPDGLFGYLQEANGIYSIPILTIIIAGYLTKFVPAIAANIGIILGSLLYIISQFILKPIFKSNALETAKASGVSDELALKTIENAAYPHFLHVMAFLFVTNILIMLIIGKLKPRQTAFTLPYTEEVDITPYKYVKQVGLAVVIIVVLSYVYFS